MAKKYRILLTTCDKYVMAIYPYAHLLKKYWPDHPEVVVVGFAPPEMALPDRFVFLSIGKQEDFPIERWSDQLILALNFLDDEVFILSLEDMWLIRPVFESVIDMAYDYMIQFEYVGRLDLTGDRLHSGCSDFHGMLGHVRLLKSQKACQYHMSTMPAFWRKEHLLKALVPNESPWQVELNGTPRLAAYSETVMVLGTDAWPLKNTLAFRGGSTSNLLLSELDAIDVEEMKANGVLAPFLGDSE